MGVFDDMLKSGESLFKNEIALDYSYLPKIIPYREDEMKQIAAVMRPLFERRTGRNMLILGPPGVGKTAACKHLVEELEEQTDEIVAVYINCWQKNTSFKILIEMCDVLGYKFTQNKRGDELFAVVKQMLNKKSAVLIFDEIDKMDDMDFLYNLVEELYRKSIILISNRIDWLNSLDPRIRSRLTPEVLEFRPYNAAETEGILQQRLEWAFVPGVWNDEALQKIVSKSVAVGDVRSGLYLMREAGIAAESRASKTIDVQDVERSVEKFNEFQIKDSDELENDAQMVLDICKKHTGLKIGELFKLYQEAGGKAAYKTFQRRIGKLEQDKFITTEKITGGSDGTTTIVHSGEKKTLDEF